MFVLHAEPDAVLGIGTKRPLSDDELRSAALSGAIESLMDWKPVSTGDYHYIPAGTVHAIGPGITLIEVQQYTDVTYRLFDYGRPRELHLDDGIAVSVATPYADGRSGRAVGGQRLVDGPFFRLWYVNNTAQIAALNSLGPFFDIPLAGKVKSVSVTGNVGDCLLTTDVRMLVWLENTQCLVASAISR